MNTEDKQPEDDFVYYTDEWNTPKEEKQIIKNNKPDGRRYKK